MRIDAQLKKPTVLSLRADVGVTEDGNMQLSRETDRPHDGKYTRSLLVIGVLHPSPELTGRGEAVGQHENIVLLPPPQPSLNFRRTATRHEQVRVGAHYSS